MHALTSLICGDPPTYGALEQIQKHLAANLDRIIARSLLVLQSADVDEVALLGPYLGRAALELGMTALVSRFDPTRVLAIRRVQVTTGFELAVKNPMAFDWSSDVQGQGKAKPWDEKPRLDQLERALLGDHFRDLFWTEAFQLLLDSAPSQRGGPWMKTLRRTNPDGFVTRARTEASMLFSQFSKGVHQELVIPVVAQFDLATVSDLLGRTFELLACLGLTASSCPALRSTTTIQPLDAFEACQEEFTR